MSVGLLDGGGDVAPAGAFDRRVTVSDVVRILRFTVGLEAPTAVELVRADIAPARIVDDTVVPNVMARIGNARLDISDVVVALRTAVRLQVVIEGR